MQHDATQKRVFADPALQKFLDARASGAPHEELEKLKRGASEEARRISAINDQVDPNGKTLDQFLSESGLTTLPKRMGTCGRPRNKQCGMLNQRECRIHHHLG